MVPKDQAEPEWLSVGVFELYLNLSSVSLHSEYEQCDCWIQLNPHFIDTVGMNQNIGH